MNPEVTTKTNREVDKQHVVLRCIDPGSVSVDLEWEILTAKPGGGDFSTSENKTTKFTIGNIVLTK